jgi:class 3 adenylate cyclase/tetratricopeptide (TPR) repeat protein
MSESDQLEKAIAALEAQRASLGDEVVDAALAPLRQKLATLEKCKHQAEPASVGERRIITILFCDVTGSTRMADKLDPEEWAELMDSAFEHLTEPVDRYGGTVARLMGDAILAFFGAPVAHEDDPQRAVAAGLAILEGVRPFREALQRDRGLDFNVRVGINTGLAMVGEVGSELYGEYTAMGDAVNLAARMEQTAQPGTVQITERTFRMVEPYFECHPLGGIGVRGKSGPVLAYRVLGRSAGREPVRGLTSHGVGSQLVGRETELAAANEVLGRLLANQGGILSIIGEAGIGKSCLLAELRQTVMSHDQISLTWLEGRALSYGQTISYWPFQEILRAYAGISEEDGEAEVWRKLESRVCTLFPEDTAEILPYLASLLTLEVRGAYLERVKYLDGEAMGQQILVASHRFFERLAAERLLVLVFEDLHWVDESSARLLEHLLPLVEQTPLLVCGLSRPESKTPAARLRQIAARYYEGCYTEIALTSLSQTDSTQLVHNLLESDDLPPRVREMMVHKAGGNPFFLEEIIRDLIEAGVVVRDQPTGRWRATAHVETISIPDTIQGVITARIDRLDEGVKRVLRTAAVIGRSFLYRVLRAILEAEQTLDQRLVELQAVELVMEKQRLPELEYIFKHSLARETVYENIPLRKRRQLHARVGQAIETLFADRLEEFYGLLAYHYSGAEEWRLARGYLLKAGDQAVGMAAGAEAVAHYRRALDVYTHKLAERLQPLQRATLALKMGEAYYGLGQHSESRQQLQQAIALLDRAVPNTKVGLLVGLSGQLLGQALHRFWPDRFSGRAPEASRAALREAYVAYGYLGNVLYLAGDPLPATYAGLRGLNLAQAIGPSPELARAYAGIGVVASLVPLHSLTEGYARLALETARSEDDPAALANVQELIGMYRAGMGHWAAAAELLGQAAAIYDRIGRLRHLDECRALLAYAGYHQGELARSQQLWQQELVPSARRRGDRLFQFYGLCCQVEIGLRLGGAGDADKAMDLLEEARAQLAEDHTSRFDGVRVYGLMAQAYLRREEDELARQAAGMAARFIAAESSPTFLFHFEGYAGVPPVYLALWELAAEGKTAVADRERMKKRARQACKGLHSFGHIFPMGRPRAWLWQGVYDWLDGKPGKAGKAWQKSLGYAERFDMPYEKGLALYEMGRHLPAGDPARQNNLNRAVEIFSQVGAAYNLTSAQEELDRSAVGL